MLSSTVPMDSVVLRLVPRMVGVIHGVTSSRDMAAHGRTQTIAASVQIQLLMITHVKVQARLTDI